MGPDLDDLKPSKALVVQQVTDGAGAMPGYKGRLTANQIQAIAQYVSQASRRTGLRSFITYPAHVTVTVLETHRQ